MQCVISDGELARLAGAPSAAELERVAPGLAARARALLERHAAPYTFSHTAVIEAIEGGEVRIEGGTVLRAPGFACRLADWRAHAVAVVAWTAGRAIDEETARLWNDGQLDDAYALDAAGSALVEAMRGEGLAFPREDGVFALPPYSPGYDGWPLEQQPALYRWLADAGGCAFTARIACLPSGMLLPKKSQLAVIGLARHAGPAAPRTLPCQGCSLAGCRFRRMIRGGACPTALEAT